MCCAQEPVTRMSKGAALNSLMFSWLVCDTLERSEAFKEAGKAFVICVSTMCENVKALPLADLVNTACCHGCCILFWICLGGFKCI